jgi:hypothetical protein
MDYECVHVHENGKIPRGIQIILAVIPLPSHPCIGSYDSVFKNIMSKSLHVLGVKTYKFPHFRGFPMPYFIDVDVTFAVCYK